MEFRTTWTAIGALTAMATLSACSGSAVSPTSEGLQTQISNDIAADAGQAVVSDIDETGNDASGDNNNSYAVVLEPRGIMVRPGAAVAAGNLTIGGRNCSETGEPQDLRYYCAPDTLTISNSSNALADTLIRQWNYEFFSQGTPQAHPDTLTDSINFGGANGVLVSVAAHHNRWHGVSHRVRNHSVTDHPSFALDTLAQSTWTGNTVATDTAEYTGTIWTIDFNGVAYDSTVQVVFQRPRGEHPFPLSGQFHRWANWSYSASGPSTKTGTISRHIVVTYNGTQTAQLQVIGSTTLTCSVDLVTGDVFDCH